MENIAIELVAAEYVRIHAEAKALEERLSELKKALIDSKVEEVTVGTATVKVSEAIRQTLDSAAVVKELGQKWVDDHSNISIYNVVRVTNKAAAKKAA